MKALRPYRFIRVFGGHALLFFGKGSIIVQLQVIEHGLYLTTMTLDFVATVLCHAETLFS